ncbi:hypothetical protein NDU88_002208 [Pleurodeles waltl]|uniref:Uncharacterized protein n=1 Tax=Pleurodeles waltl TaxID=8319 RepID=A0AAV7Q5C5_PLEWA|nr:hypothetical protein NDU88_002208 [Pleurodeles waltl]
MRYYSLAFFFVPACIWFLLGLRFQEHTFIMCRCKGCTGCCHCSPCCSVLGKAGLPAAIWWIILLFDGRYLDCFYKSFMKIKPTSNTVVGTQPPSPTGAYLVSQVIGMLLFLVVLLVFLLVTYFPVWYCKCGEQVCKEGQSYDEIQYEQLMVEEAKLQIMEKTQEKRSQAIKTLLDQKMQCPSQVGGSNVWDKTTITEQVKPLLQNVVGWVKNKLAPPATNDNIGMRRM